MLHPHQHPRPQPQPVERRAVLAQRDLVERTGGVVVECHRGQPPLRELLELGEIERAFF